jgi:serine/threonine protein kinase
MTSDEWERLRQLFHDALDRSPEERAALLRQLPAGEERIRRELASLLASEPDAEGFLAVSAMEALRGADPTAAPALSAGTRLGPFQILEPLGSGGMGEVYRARDTRLDRTVAIKVLPRDLASDPHTRERFEREARLVSKLNHPHICTLYDIGSAVVDGAEVQFLVMELLDGETLAARLKRGPLPLAGALQIARDIVEGLAAAHAVGIVHRDLKPANIMLTSSGVKLLDFGLARLRMTGGTPTDVSLTVEGLVLGTIPYMSPEQLRGEETDARADLFAFGAVLHEMVTGQRAFAADSEAALIAAILERDPPPLTSQQPLAPPALDRLVAACLAKDREHRWQHARDLALAIDGIIGGHAAVEPGHAAALRPPSTISPSLDRTRFRLHAMWAVVALAAGLSAWMLRPADPDTLPPANPRHVFVLMDSPLVGRVYDPRTLAAGGTNADDISDALRDLGVVTHKENTSPFWHREEQVREQNPDLIISHLSCLYDVRAGKGDPETERHLFDIAEKRLTSVFGYLGAVNARTRFLVYSRGRFTSQEAETTWANDVVARFPQLKGRLFAMIVPGSSNATFRDPATAELLRARVRKIVALP